MSSNNRLYLFIMNLLRSYSSTILLAFMVACKFIIIASFNDEILDRTGEILKIY